MNTQRRIFTRDIIEKPFTVGDELTSRDTAKASRRAAATAAGEARGRASALAELGQDSAAPADESLDGISADRKQGTPETFGKPVKPVESFNGERPPEPEVQRPDLVW